jgi:hypothetical protein
MQGPKSILHVRGTWSARDDRTPSAVWLAILWIGMILGFGLDIHRFRTQAPPAPPVLYVHAVVFTVWMFLLTAQVLLVLRDRVALHRKLGWFLAAWACLMAILGPWAAMAADASTVNGKFTGTAFLAVNAVDIGGFLILLVWGILLRKNPAAHRRMMILSTISLADPGFDRALGHLVPYHPHSAIVSFFCVFYGNVLLIALMAGWDLWRGRLMRSFIIGASGLLAAELLASFLYFWPPWEALTLNAVQFWARHFA